VAAVPSIGRAARVEGALAPEADLTRALYEQYANQIFRYCLHQLGSREEAEDAVQSTFLNAFRGIRRGIVPELESAWLFKIAHNVCLSRRRTTWRRGRIESPTDFDVVEELAPAPSRRADELIGLQDVLEQLPDNQRRAILLREWQGLSYREIAEELDLSQAAVETLIFRARRALASGLEQPPERKRRVVRGADIGNLLAGLKSLLLGGGAAAKVAATVAVVSASTVVAAAPVQQHRAHSHAVPKPAAQTSRPSASSTPTSTSSTGAASVAGPEDAFPARGGTRSHGPARAHGGATGGFSPAIAVSTPDVGTVEVPAQPVAGTPEPTPVTPASEPAATPTDTGHAEPQHAPATTPATTPADKTTPAKTDKTTTDKTTTDKTDKSKTETSAGQTGTTSTSQSANGDPKATDSDQRTSSSSGGGSTTQPVVSSPGTVTNPVTGSKSTSTIQVPATIPMTEKTATQYGATQSAGSQSSGSQSSSSQSSSSQSSSSQSSGSQSSGSQSSGQSSGSQSSGKSSPPAATTPTPAPAAPVAPPAPVVTPPATTTQTAPTPKVNVTTGTTTVKFKDNWGGGSN
jgi:RNA polymerase sigma factor (sigma-70 family)